MLCPGHLSAAPEFGGCSGAGFSCYAITRLTEINCSVVEDQEWLPYKYDESKIMVLTTDPLLGRRSASVVKVRKGARLEVEPKYREELAHYGMSMNYARLVRRRYSSASTDLTAISALEEQHASTVPASVTANAVMARVEVPAERSH